ncbi:ABC transporter ATP-binding protein/permease [Acidimangrovimonas sediminis]|uniref:ABC transporter ATP-binding protein/permease n=1 Tax=Acidimangrovimonas sediminis TaxID=2056283 RepID=UPI000C7F8623|nr:ATP-binding cassette domain-containing protein [Acidimangrovimonas sediminis]
MRDKRTPASRSGRRRRPSGPLAAIEAPARAAQARAGRLAILGGLLWPVQAALVAWAIAGWLTHAPLAHSLVAGAGFAVAGILRALLDQWGGAILFRAADEVLASERAAAIARESLRSAGGVTGGADGGPSSAALGALVAQKLPLLVPYLTHYRPARFRVMVLPFVFIALTAWVSWVAALILVVAGPLIPLFMALVGMAAKEASARQMVEIGDMNALLMDRLAALADIRLLDATERTARDFGARAEGLRVRTMAVLRIAFLSSTVLELFSALGVAMMAVYVGFSLLGQINFGAWGHLSVGEGIFLLLLAPEYFQPLRDLAAAWHDKAAADAVAEELAAGAAAEATPVLGEGATAAPLPGPLSLRVEGAAVRRGSGWVRLPNFTLARGEALALTGPSGAGKSTALAAIAGLARAEVGEITVAGAPLTDANADAWRARLAWVGQAPHFLDAALAENLDLRATGADPAPALAAARAEGVVAGLPGGLAARLGETGGGISGGEARRLTLARALMAAPDLLLADEPTADLDAETALAVIAALMALKARGTALIVATHDEGLIAAMDRAVAVPARGPARAAEDTEAGSQAETSAETEA